MVVGWRERLYFAALIRGRVKFGRPVCNLGFYLVSLGYDPSKWSQECHNGFVEYLTTMCIEFGCKVWEEFL